MNNIGLGRINTSSFMSDKDQALNAALWQISQIIQNHDLLTPHNHRKILSMNQQYIDEGYLSPAQLSKIDDLYEKSRPDGYQGQKSDYSKELNFGRKRK